jgi:GTPase SAR1 family protein
MLMYSVTNKTSFQEIMIFYNELAQHRKPLPPMTVVATCIDKKEKRVVTELAGKQLANQLNAHYWEISSKTGDNVNPSFEDLLASVTVAILNDPKKKNKYTSTFYTFNSFQNHLPRTLAKPKLL